MRRAEIEKRVAFHLGAIEQAKAAIEELAKAALRTPEVQAMPGAEVREMLREWGLSGAQATVLIVESVRAQRSKKR